MEKKRGEGEGRGGGGEVGRRCQGRGEEKRTRGGEEEWRGEVGDEERGGEEVKRRIFSVQQNNHTVMATFIYELCSSIYPKMLFFWRKSQEKPLYVCAYVVKIGFSEFSQGIKESRNQNVKYFIVQLQK